MRGALEHQKARRGCVSARNQAHSDPIHQDHHGRVEPGQGGQCGRQTHLPRRSEPSGTGYRGAGWIRPRRDLLETSAVVQRSNRAVESVTNRF